MTYQLSLEGKTALITAAGQGIGRASAEAFVRAGASVIATDINETSLAELNAIDGINAWKLDATDPEDIQRVQAEVGTLDVLFNCAGYVHAGSILESTEDDWDVHEMPRVEPLAHQTPLHIHKADQNCVHVTRRNLRFQVLKTQSN